jgi:hypothetical protein
LCIIAADRIIGECEILPVGLGFVFRDKLFVLPLLYLLLLLEIPTSIITNITSTALLIVIFLRNASIDVIFN